MSVAFTKNNMNDPYLPEYQDRITDKIWLTRLNEPGSDGNDIINIKYYIDNNITITNGMPYNDANFKYGSNNTGGTYGLKWGILSTTNLPNPSAPGINTNFFAVYGNPTNFFHFSQFICLLSGFIDSPTQIVSLNGDINTSLDWRNTANDDYFKTNYYPIYYLFPGMDIACYIPEINQYFHFNLISINNTGGLSYTRSVVITPPQPQVSYNFSFPMKPLYTNNAMVFYKSHSNSFGSVGTVRNYRKKSRNT